MNCKLLMSLTSLDASRWKCLKEVSAAREKHCRFSMALISLKRQNRKETKRESHINKQKTSTELLVHPKKCVLPAVCYSCGLHKAGSVCLFEQLVGECHQTCLLHQPLLLKDLNGQSLLSSAPGSLQRDGCSPLTLGDSCSKLSDAVSQLVQSHSAVSLQRNTGTVPWVDRINRDQRTFPPHRRLCT